MYNFTLVNCDTDSITFCKSDGASFDEDEQQELLLELNNLFPKRIKWEHDGIFKRLIVLKAKNYILWDGKKIKLKGASLKDQKKEPALREMMNEVIECLVHGTTEQALGIYRRYIQETDNVTDIKRWCTKRSVSKSILKCKGYTEEDIENKVVRRNETVVWDAVKDIPVQEGDKIYLYPAVFSSMIERKEYKNGKVKEKVIKTVGLKRNDVWTGDHDSDKLKERVNDTISILSGVLDTESIIGVA